jgi:predicted RNA-binding protein with PUA-like domain
MSEQAVSSTPDYLVYVGVRFGANGKLIHAYRQYNQVDHTYQDQTELWFKHPLFPGTPGMCLSAKISHEESTQTVSNAHYFERWPDLETVLSWQAASQAVETAVRAEAAEKKLRETDLVKSHLEPLRLAVQRMTSAERRNFLALVINYLVRV